MDEELTDDALLGEATLAKLSAAREDATPAPAEAPAANPAPAAPQEEEKATTDAPAETDAKG